MVLVIFSMNALAIELKGEFLEGSLITGKAPLKSTVKAGEKKLLLTDGGIFTFGLGYRSEEIKISVVDASGQMENHNIKVLKRIYDVQRIDGLHPDKVNPPKSILNKIKEEQKKIKDVRTRASSWSDFKEGFIWPVLGRISGVYGSQRILNGELRSPHFGVDIAAPVGRPVISPAGGVVVLSENDFYFSGGTIIIDHGHGISSSFLHLSKLEVTVGQRVIKGQIIGEIGATGRVTGPHLDWRVNWFDQRLDPQLLVDPMPEILIPPPPMRP
ncbi:MAG: peptidase [Rhodospirillaceae bacterium]|nr:peptidase [Rhodospirillaceae bacterium]